MQQMMGEYAFVSKGREFETKELKLSTRKLVEPKGFEPLTPTMPLWCSTN